MDNNGIDPNAGMSGDPNSGIPDSGNQGDNGLPQDNPQGQGGQPAPDPRDAKIAELTKNNRSLNQAIINARRGQPQQNAQPQNGDQSPFSTPEGQYAISLELATGQLSRNLEQTYDLYPEIPAGEIARIRKNPWAFASYESFRSGDVQTAMLEIEQALLDRATELGGQGQNQPGQANVVPTQKQVPASINPNPAQEPADDAEPGSQDDENLFTMPLGKLEQKAKKEIAQKQNKR